MRTLIQISIISLLLCEALIAGNRGESDSPLPTGAQEPLAGELVKRQALAAGGIKGTSTNFVLSSIYGQATGGAGSSSSYRLNSGFWPGQDGAAACSCGDADGNGIITISDAVFLINYIFAGGPAPSPLCRGDADGNGLVSISDVVYLINYIFAGGPVPHCP